MGEGDVAPISVTPAAIPLLYLYRKNHWGSRKNSCSYFGSDVRTRTAEKQLPTYLLVLARAAGDPTTIIVYLIISWAR